MIQFACLFSLVLLCQCSYGYPTEDDIIKAASIKNATSFIPSASINQSQETKSNLTIDPATIITGQLSNSSYYEELQGFAKKVVAKVKGGFNKVKTKVNVGIGKIKSKINQVKNNIGDGTGTKGIGGVGTGTHYYRRPSGGGGSMDPTVLWVLLGLGIAGVLGTMLYFMVKQ